MKRNLIGYSLVALNLIPTIGKAEDNRPNILVLIADQHSGKIMTQTGYPYIKTPGIDRIAKEGVTFTRSYCAYPVSVANRAAMMTGIMPSKSNEDLTAYPALGKKMKDAGYETAYLGKWHVSNSKIEKVADWHGFETYKDLMNDSKTEELTLNFLNKAHNKPFFLISSYLNPHDCCELARNISKLNNKYHDGPVEEKMNVENCPPLPINFAIPPDEAEGFYCRRTPDSTDVKNFGKHPVKYWGETEWRQYMYGYDRLVEKMDNHVLNVINTLEKQGLLENTIVFYTSDHGDGHAMHQWNQKMNFYEEVVNIPFIISWKGHTKAGVIDSKTLISNGLDLYPTICKLAGVELDDAYHGKDVMDFALKGKNDVKDDRNYIVSEINQTYKSKKENIPLVGRMVVTKDFKYYVFNAGENKEQLFDLVKDPGEEHPVTNLPEYKNQLLAHRQMLKEWIKKTNDPFLSSKSGKNKKKQSDTASEE